MVRYDSTAKIKMDGGIAGASGLWLDTTFKAGTVLEVRHRGLPFIEELHSQGVLLEPLPD